MCSGCLDHTAGAGVNNSGYAAGLCVKKICFGHEVTCVIEPVAKCLTRCNEGADKGIMLQIARVLGNQPGTSQ
jgi:hypothetical protein